MNAKEIIARRAALEPSDNNLINLGIGLPTMIANFVPADVEIVLQSENGILGVGPKPAPGEGDWHIYDAGGGLVTVKPGAMFFDSAYSFSLIRGGHVDITFLGALQVDEQGNLASWMVPGRRVTGMGGAMDLVVGAKRVVITMEHTQKGTPKLLAACTYPLTAVGVVDRIITELAVIDVTPKGFVVRELAEGVTFKDVCDVTDAPLIPDDQILKMRLAGVDNREDDRC
ncbi:MAG TPA: 3-oxoacid CoA-transferase subunit B [Clostridiaceae bacterium]|jgi:acetate CoA/acetoacetate CoA-transferase beta subunit|nr:3-oxoacid CoA-transferase subunit B [Clostridiaceae bacterium]